MKKIYKIVICFMIVLILPVFIYCFYHFYLSDSVKDILVPVKFVNIPPGFTIVHPYTKVLEARITFTGTPSDRLDDFEYLIDLNHAESGNNAIPINRKNLKLPARITINRIIPFIVNIRLEKELIKKLPVSVKYTGVPATGYFLDKVVIKPDKIILKGPEKILEKMESVKTSPVNISGLTKSFRKQVIFDFNENVTSKSGDMVIASFNIKERKVLQKLKGINVAGKGTKFSYEIVPSTIDLEINGPSKIIKKTGNISKISVYIDLKGLSSGVYVRRATINLPVSMSLLKVTPENFTVTIKK